MKSILEKYEKYCVPFCIVKVRYKQRKDRSKTMLSSTSKIIVFKVKCVKNVVCKLTVICVSVLPDIELILITII